MEFNQALNNALRLADLDFGKIQVEIREEFNDSLDAYFDYLSNLTREFELALSHLVLNTDKVQLTHFVNINIGRLDVAIRHTEIFKKLCEGSKDQIESNAINCDLINNFFLPIHDAHYSQLVYLRRLLNDLIEEKGGNTQGKGDSLEEEKVNEVSLPDEDHLLDEYSDPLSMKDMEAIFKVRRNAIYKYEKEGYFPRCSPPNKPVLFKKDDIKRYLSSRGKGQR